LVVIWNNFFNHFFTIGMTKSISCADLGHQGCEFHAHADSEEELLKQVKAHAAESHEITEFTPEVIEQVKSKIKEE